ncbi:phosphotransferase enzyme family-domain-containing protein [Podospora aff. communis PSN243]|uniref:Phosphotransferase enzyme family-domain-containing protein n=1 Tax=Podospora aff. communis PSN243 TaxID=3040156 RepID=A0AAV9GGE4_9PEZI|nr:phosphotransferase enzyme family-domain-containing protein [Podospora aff. communis PSN243]
MPPPKQDGLRWKETLFDLVPEWTRDPSTAAIEKMCRQHLGIPAEESCTAAFHASGLFNKLYRITCTNGPPMMLRVSLPVYPCHKTRAEVATLRNDNYIGFEWILMEYMEGTSAHVRWRTMSMEQKAAFAERMAQFQAEMVRLGKESLIRGIGTLDIRDEIDDGEGPFRSSHDWLSTVLDIILRHHGAILEKSDDEDDREDAEEVSSVARKLLALVPKIFPATLEQSETTALYHHDLHLNNVLVDDNGKITAVLDWECVSAMPLWMTAKLPKFLEGPAREEEPQKDAYLDAEPMLPDLPAEVGEPGFGDEGKNELYHIHKMEYEATQLRKVYKARLGKLWPEWPLDKSHAQIDLFEAIS